MNDFAEVRVHMDEEHNVTIMLVGANASTNDEILTVPADLLEDFRYQLDRVLGP